LWLVDNGSSRHITGDRDNLTSLIEERLSQKVGLGDNNYAVKGIGKTSIELESGDNVHLQHIICARFEEEFGLYFMLGR